LQQKQACHQLVASHAIILRAETWQYPSGFACYNLRITLRFEGAHDMTTVDHQAATITGIDLAGYLTEDPKRAIAFYRDQLGMEPTEIDPQGRGAEFTLPDGSTFGVWKLDEGPSKGSMIMFAVADIHAAVAAFRAKGVQLGDVDETPACFMAFGADPDGNGIIVHQRK